jgi:hypothetical protein
MAPSPPAAQSSRTPHGAWVLLVSGSAADVSGSRARRIREQLRQGLGRWDAGQLASLDQPIKKEFEDGRVVGVRVRDELIAVGLLG